MSRQMILRLLLLFLAVCLNAGLLMGLPAHKAHAGAGGIEGGNCTDTSFGSPMGCFGNCATATPAITGGPDTFAVGPSLVTQRALFASTALQFDSNNSIGSGEAGQIPSMIDISGQFCNAALGVFHFGLVTGGITDAQGDVTNTAEMFGPVTSCCSPSLLSPPLACAPFGGSPNCSTVPPIGQALPPTPQYLTGFVSTTNTMRMPRTLHQATLFSFAFTVSVPSGAPTTAFTAAGKVLITGGSSDLSNQRHLITALSSAEVFTFNGSFPGDLIDPPENGTFAMTGSMNAARTLHQATLLDPMSGKVLITGGLNEKRQALNSAEIYDPNTGTFTLTKGEMRHARFGHTATLLSDGTVLITGGATSGQAYPYLNGRSGVIASAELYNPASDSFSEVGRMQVARVGHTASRIANTSNVLIAGGISGGIVTNTAELYNFSTKTFSTVGNMNYPRFLHSAASLSTGEVLIAGGSSDPKLQTSLQTRELFDDTKNTFVPINATSPPLMSFARRGFAAGADIPIEYSDMVVLPGGLDSMGTPQGTTDIYLPPPAP